MKYKLILSFLILTLLGLGLFYGCGGSDGVVSPSSISENQGDTSQTGGGYITVKIVWPQAEASDICSLSTGEEENTLTASMPGDAVEVKIQVREKDAAVDDLLLLPDGSKAEDTIEWSAGEDRTTIGPIPSVWVTVRAIAYDESGNELSVSEEDLLVKVNQNTVGLNLGDYKLTLDAEPVISGLSITGSAGGGPTETPTPVVLPTATPSTSPYDTYNINANLSLIYPSTGTGSDPTPVPMEAKSIKFTIIEGDDIASFDDGTTSGTNEIIEETGPEGNCNTTLKLEDEGTVVVEATYEVNSQIYSETCVINGDFDYSFDVDLTYDKLPALPDLIKETEVIASLDKILPSSDNKPASGKQVDFEILNLDNSPYTGSDVFLSYPSDITDADGKAKVYLICNKALGNGLKTLQIKTTVEVGSPGNTEIKESYQNIYIGDYELSLPDVMFLDSPDEQASIPAYLTLKYPDGDFIPLTEKEIEFNITETTVAGDLTVKNGFTDANGYCGTSFDPTTNKVGTAVIEATFTDGINTYSDSFPLHVYPTRFDAHNIEKLNFPYGEGYKPGDVMELRVTLNPSPYFSLEGVPIKHWISEGPTGTEILPPQEGIVDSNNQATVSIKIGSEQTYIVYTFGLYRTYDEPDYLFESNGYHYGGWWTP